MNAVPSLDPRAESVLYQFLEQPRSLALIAAATKWVKLVAAARPPCVRPFGSDGAMWVAEHTLEGVVVLHAPGFAAAFRAEKP